MEGELALPPQLLPLWHSLAIICHDVTPAAHCPRIDVDFEPAPLRESQRLNWNGTLPAESSASLAVEYLVSFSHIDELPSDSSRGVDLEPAAIRYTLHGDARSAMPNQSRLLFTNGALL